MAKLPEIKFSLAEDSFFIQYKMSEAYSNMKNPHAHTFYEIFYVLSGAKTYTIQGTTIEVNKGDLVFIPPEQMHQTFSFAPVHCERILINFSQHFVDAELVRASFERRYQQESRPVVRFDMNEQTAVEHLLGNMLHEAKVREPGNTGWFVRCCWSCSFEFTDWSCASRIPLPWSLKGIRCEIKSWKSPIT